MIHGHTQNDLHTSIYTGTLMGAQHTNVYTQGHRKCTYENTYVCKQVGMHLHMGTHTRTHMVHTHTLPRLRRRHTHADVNRHRRICTAYTTL